MATGAGTADEHFQVLKSFGSSGCVWRLGANIGPAYRLRLLYERNITSSNPSVLSELTLRVVAPQHSVMFDAETNAKRQRIGGVLGVVGIGAIVLVGQYSGGDDGGSSRWPTRRFARRSQSCSRLLRMH